MSWRTLLSLHSSRNAINKLKSISNSPFPTIIFKRLPVSSFTGYRNLHSHSPELGNSLIDPSLRTHFNNDVVHQNDDDDETTNEFLSRFAWIMRKKVKESYPDSDKSTVDAMLLVIVERVASEMDKDGGATASFSPFDSVDFSEDLWRTVWEVSNKVLVDMNKERKKEKMKGFLQCDEVKEMCRFAGEVGIRGNLLRELRFKWAREKMEEHEFNEELEKLRKEGQVIEEEVENDTETETNVDGDVLVGGNVEESKVGNKVVGLPKRKGKMRFKIYGLDLSDPKWERVADRIHEAGEVLWPKEAKPITGKCKQVTEKILSLKEDGDDNLLTLMAEWVELLQPARVDWINLLDRLKNQNSPFYFKVAEMVLTEDSFQTNISDYSRLIDMYAKENRIDDTERMLKKMNENGIQQDASIASVLVHMYSKIGNLERAEEAFKVLNDLGFQPDTKVYNSMIMAYINAGEPTKGETLMRQMDTRDIKPTKEIYMSLLRYYSQRGDFDRASRTSTSLQFAGHQQTMETCTLLIEAAAVSGDLDKVSSNFDHMVQLGHKPDDRCTAAMIRAYKKTNLLDKALDLLLTLEKDGFEPGVATYSVLIDWLAKMQLVDEAEQILNKIALLGEAPPFKVQVSLCDMYARTKMEKKALQTLGVLIARKNELKEHEFERVISGLIGGGFLRDAQRMHGIMEAQGFKASGQLLSALTSGHLPLSMRS
ncbi:pentatricopeptide repeat-containing protein At5g04810, chloroplastic [Lathyrus oleraceus]|uniref:PROP1-like PPR domain-containing protein n=1 Tax=Pisum sativum TaxID=3888 RepID=A0A9D5A3H9_PEA|nr:pentatricopeptide repeat-containing protein At5g04810, chloroplastic [Pisum sativum]KAI5392933.1 hypothetical protein KIW84_060186 [Pisum sativum]